MRLLLKSYKTEINPTPEQAAKIRQTIGVCRYVYNFYITENKAEYERTGGFLSAYTFSKWLNNEYLPSHDDKAWVRDVSSKAVKQAICNAERAFKNFFAGRTGYPRYKKKRSNHDTTMYFVKTDSRTIIACDRHRIKIPTLGWVRIKEKGYIPTNPDTHTIKSGTVSHHAGRYYVSVLVEEIEPAKPTLKDGGIGIDLGVKDFAILSDGTVFRNINKTSRVRRLNKRLKHEQRRLSRQYEMLKQKGESTQRKSNITKQKQLVQKLYARITAIRTDYVNKAVAEIVKTKPSYITVEDLNVVGMMKNRHLARAVQEQRFSEFRTKLGYKCARLGIELRIVDRFYPSSKTCHCCGNKKADITLKDRTYVCEACGYSKDRDLNAALNLRDAAVYKIA